MSKSLNSCFWNLFQKSDKPVPKSRGNSVQSDSPALDSAQLVTGNVLAKAIHPWHAKKDTHLTFAKGDILRLKKKADNWFFGEKTDKDTQQGWFPAQCVEILMTSGQPDHSQNESFVGEMKKNFHSNPSVDSHTGSVGEGESPLYISVFDYVSDVEGDLAFHVGEVVRVTHKDGDWWTGVIGSRTGIFPV